MASFKPVSYWQKYRKIRKEVRNHVFAVHQIASDSTAIQTEDLEESTSDSDKEHSAGDLSYNSSSFIENQTQQLSEENPPTFQETELSHCKPADITDTNTCNPSFNAEEQQTYFIANDEIHDEPILTSDSGSELDLEDESALALLLADWAKKFGTSHTAINDLLRILRPYHSSLPKDARTLLKTVKVYNISNLAGGSYYHFGITEYVRSLTVSSLVAAEDIEEIKLQINIDGLPLFKSSNSQFWPILGRVIVPFLSSPFIIGLYLGNQKPQNVSEYTSQLTEELDNLIQNGIVITVDGVDRQIPFNLSCIICDTPARVFIKCCKSYSGYFGCDKCSQRGVWKGKITFPETNAPRRTDASFNAMSNPEHHLELSPFRQLPIGMVSQFPLDYMHLVCLGVMKRLIWLWMKGPLNNSCRVGTHVVRQISDKLLGLKNHLPREFSRKGRSLFDVDRWKATEFRQFMLYSGPVILKNQLSQEKYKHFLLLFVGIFCLSCEFVFEAYCEYAGEILCLFVEQFGGIYGEDMLVYNVHGLTHLSEDAKNFGLLDNFSSFAFESFLGNIKRLVRKPSLPLQQVIRRISEGQNLHGHTHVRVATVAKKSHTHGPVPRQFEAYPQYQELHLPDCYISIHEGDNCVLIGDKVALVRNILTNTQDTEKLVVYEKFGNMTNFFTYPLQSMDLRIAKVTDLTGNLSVCPVSSVVCKCVLLPFRRKYIAFPLIHKFQK